MILYGGNIYDSREQDRLLDEMEGYINHTLAEKTLTAEQVIGAIDRLGKEIAGGKFDRLTDALQTEHPERYKLLAASLLSRENLEFKIETELGGIPGAYITAPPGGLASMEVRTMPLGVIMVAKLRQAKGVLQTAGLICEPGKRALFTELFSRCGVTRVTSAGNMSAYFCGEAHDGEYPLRRYIRTVNVEI